MLLFPYICLLCSRLNPTIAEMLVIRCCVDADENILFKFNVMSVCYIYFVSVFKMDCVGKCWTLTYSLVNFFNGYTTQVAYYISM
uniref:Uncharacterized protein n=1 Tax=uncultured marine virus TaxID=186617 RepID=A0A0F7L502_9VIRU|nr:hypothetical protein [uncultured marine virus]